VNQLRSILVKIFSEFYCILAHIASPTTQSAFSSSIIISMSTNALVPFHSPFVDRISLCLVFYAVNFDLSIDFWHSPLIREIMIKPRWQNSPLRVQFQCLYCIIIGDNLVHSLQYWIWRYWSVDVSTTKLSAKEKRWLGRRVAFIHRPRYHWRSNWISNEIQFNGTLWLIKKGLNPRGCCGKRRKIDNNKLRLQSKKLWNNRKLRK